MPITIELDSAGRLSCPRVRCDRCGKLIKKAIDGVYYWKPGEKTPQANFAHTECEARFKDHPPTSWGCLEVFLLYLSNNLKVNKDRQAKMARLNELIGS